MKVQIIVLTENQKKFFATDADASDVDYWLETQMKTAPVVEVFAPVNVYEGDSAWKLAAGMVERIEREIEDVIVTEQEMNEE